MAKVQGKKNIAVVMKNGQNKIVMGYADDGFKAYDGSKYGSKKDTSAFIYSLTANKKFKVKTGGEGALFNGQNRFGFGNDW